MPSLGLLRHMWTSASRSNLVGRQRTDGGSTTIQFKYVYINWMPRTPLSPEERACGGQLAELLHDRRQRVGLSSEALARTAGISVETLRRIERGLVPSPGFFTVASVARVLQLSLDELAKSVQPGTPRAGS